MAQRVVFLGSRSGLHARPAATFSKAAAQAAVPVTLATHGRGPVAASSLLGILTLGVQFGEQVTLTAEGDGAESVLDHLAEMLSSELDA